MEQEKYQTDDEIDLMDYLKVILKSKVFILAVFLLALIAAGIFSFFSPKVYEIDTVLEIGIVGEETIEAPAQLMGKIEGNIYGTLIMAKLNISERAYPEIKAENLKDTTLVKKIIQSSEPKQAKQILKEGNELIIADHQEKIELEKTLLGEKIKTTEENIKVLEKNIERVETKILSLEQEKRNLEAKIVALQQVLIYQQDPGSQFALFDTKEKLEAKKQEIEDGYLQINSLGMQINDLKSQIHVLEKQIANIQPTLVIKQPTVSQRPIKPRPLLNMAIAGVLGLFIGAFLVFGREWWKQSKDLT
jgi:capsular polysaccharide biosynthesis protein